MGLRLGQHPTQGDEKRLGPATTLYVTAPLSLSSRPKRSVAKRSAVFRVLASITPTSSLL
jgi:hypothetical protein